MPDYSDAIVETVREPLLILDSDLRVKLANRSFYQAFKVAPGESIGRLVYELGNGQWNIPALRKLLEELLPASAEFNDYQVEHEFPHIGQRTMLLNARRLRDGDRKAELILLCIEDITDRRRAELEIARQRAWFRTALSSIGDAVIATDADACVSYLNPTAEKMTGYSAAEAAGKPLHEVFNIVNEESRKGVESPVSKAIRQGAIVGLANHTVLIARDGRECPIDDSAAPIFDADGKIAGVIMVFHDITERRRMERLMHTSEIRFRRLFEAAHDGILVLDVEQRRITDVNPFILKLLDYPREFFIGKELWEIGVFSDKAESQSAMERLREKGSIRFEDKPLQDRNGRRVPVEIVANIYQEDHHPVIQCNIRDISERKRFEDEREAHLINEQSLRMEAEGANRAKDMFLATLSHEMRTPLSAIVGWMSILRNEGCEEKDRQEGLDVIDRNTRAQVQLIDDVLDVSRIVSGKLRLDIQRCEFIGVINAAIGAVQAAADAKQISIERKLDPDASTGSCDPGRLQQVVWNLLSNAIKFTPKGGRISIMLDRHRSTARITVSDNGPGITADFLPFVFDRFRQADSSTRRKFGGLGLGLSIVKQLVEMHGGTVQVQSGGENRGATFTVNLPVKAIAVAAPEETHEDRSNDRPASASTENVRLDGLHIVVVDDEPDSLRLVGKLLADAGAVVTTAANVPDAMRAIEKTRPDVLVSDLAMPDDDGYDLIRQVRASGRGPKQLPAVALTAFAHKGYARSALLAGYQVHVPKPVDPRDLTAVIASLTGRTGGAS